VTTASKLPSPPSATQHVSESHHLTRERSFSPSSNLNEILRILRSDSATGTLSIDINQGGVGSIRFSERHKVSFDEK
jgi:hypothetical protein